jgi:hypothetical protein
VGGDSCGQDNKKPRNRRTDDGPDTTIRILKH